MVDLTKFSIVSTGHSTRNAVKKVCPFDFVNNDSSVCVVTVGDSWTWGCDMTDNDDEHHRLSNNYGRLVADHLQADWLNLGQGGSSNFWIYDRVAELATVIPTWHYDKIYVICTFTEVGRAVDARTDIDFYNFLHHNDITQFLSYLNQHCVSNIVSALKPFDHVTVKIGTNFVDYAGPQFAELLPTPWVKLMCDHFKIDYDHQCHVVSSWVIDSFRSIMALSADPTKYLAMLESWINPAIQRAQLLIKIPGMTYTIDPMRGSTNTGHPGAAGHRLWADYIIKSL